MRTVIFIVGMGRSGTSALARLLSLRGAILPKRLVPPNGSNEKGHWEPSAALRINEAFLRAHRSSWFDPELQPQPGSAIGERETDLLIERATGFLAQEAVPEGHSLVVKEPRISALLSFWIAAAERAEFVSKVIFIYRHPAEVAASLRTRNMLQRDHAYLLWLKYNLLAERDSRNSPRTFVTFDDLIEDPGKALASTLAELQLDLPTTPNRETLGFIARELRHHNDHSPITDDLTPGCWIARTYDLLGRTSKGALSGEAFDTIYREYAEWLVRTNELRPQRRHWRIRLAHLVRRQPSPLVWRRPMGIANS